MPDTSQVIPQKIEDTSQEATRAKIKELSERLRRKEATEVDGAPGLEPKSRLLAGARIMSDQDPDHYYRYVNITDPTKVENRRDRGYVPVTEEEAKKTGTKQFLGKELSLFKIPREEYEKRERSKKELHQARLRAHKADVKRVAESVVRELRDTYGLDIDVERVLVDDER